MNNVDRTIPQHLTPLTQDQLILARSRLWTPELDKLLRKWKTQIGKRERGHLNQNRKYGRRHYILGGPAIILSTIVSVGIFATFRNCDECDDQGVPECQIDQWIRLASGILGLGSMGLTAFLTFMNYADVAADHKSAADDFGSMFRSLDTMLIVPAPVRGDPQSTLQNIRNQYDDIVRRSPTLPSKYDVGLSFEVIGKNRLPKPPQPGQISSHILSQPGKITPHTTTDLKKLISDEKHYTSDNSGSSSTSTINEIGDYIAQENDHDTDDEEIEVKLAFDLDDVQNYNVAAAAYAAAELAARREHATQNSLQAALAFEMQRLDGNGFSQAKLANEPSKKRNKVRLLTPGRSSHRINFPSFSRTPPRDTTPSFSRTSPRNTTPPLSKASPRDTTPSLSRTSPQTTTPPPLELPDELCIPESIPEKETLDKSDVEVTIED